MNAVVPVIVIPLGILNE
jgi:hypothetical protein